MIIETTRFGKLEVDEGKAILFEDGIPGFPGRKSFVILEGSPESPFRWLQCIEDGALAFIVMDPCLIVSEYLDSIGDQHLKEVGLEDPSEAVILSIVRIQRDVGKITTNLLAPVLINPQSRKAKQVILMGSGYDVAHEVMILPERYPPQASCAEKITHLGQRQP